MMNNKCPLPVSEMDLVVKKDVGDWKEPSSSPGVNFTQLQLIVDM